MVCPNATLLTHIRPQRVTNGRRGIGRLIVVFRRLIRSVQGRQSAQDKLDRQSSLAQYNTYDARQLFSDLLRRVRSGEVIVIAHAGHPVAKLVPFEDDRPRRPGVIRAHVVLHNATPEN
jgi:prevent-host-death family protein